MNSILVVDDLAANLKFVESSFEDYEFSLDTMVRGTSILYTNKAIYNYRIVNEGKNVTGLPKYFQTFSDYEEIYDRILNKYPNLPFPISESIRKKQLYLHLNYLNVIFNSDMSLIDKRDVVENLLIYLKCKYELSEEEIIKVIGKTVSSDIDKDEIKQKIKNILIKY